jgi:hypothetical protein
MTLTLFVSRKKYGQEEMYAFVEILLLIYFCPREKRWLQAALGSYPDQIAKIAGRPACRNLRGTVWVEQHIAIVPSNYEAPGVGRLLRINLTS